MARLNPNYDKTITLFNCLKGVDNPDAKTDVWYKRVLTDCFFKTVMQQVASGVNSQMVGVYTVRIPMSNLYKPYAEWAKLSAANRARYFTIRNDDVVILGSSLDVISNASPNTAPQIVAKNKPNAFKVTATSDNSSGIEPHYRLGG